MNIAKTIISDTKNPKAFRVEPVLKLLSLDSDLSSSCVDAFEFFTRMLAEQGEEKTIETLRDLAHFLKKNIDLETKHLDSGANTVFSQVEEKYYNPEFKRIFKFLDFKIWMYVGVMFVTEASYKFAEQIISDFGNEGALKIIETPMHYLGAISLLLCGTGIIYDQYEKNIEAKILGQIKKLSERIITQVPEAVLHPRDSNIHEEVMEIRR